MPGQVYNSIRKREGKPERKPTKKGKKMTYEEMIARVKEAIEMGKPLHGWMMDIAIDLALEEMEKEGR